MCPQITAFGNIKMNIADSEIKSAPLQDSIIKILLTANANAPIKLIEHCKAFNTAYENTHYITCAILIRAILDYIPTIFGFENIARLSSQLNGKRTFKDALDQLEQAIRKVADDALHNPANKIEIIKVTKATIDNQTPNLIIVLEIVARQLKEDDLRDVANDKIAKQKEIVIAPSKSQLQLFEEHVADTGNWYREFIDKKEIWIFKKDNLFQIHEQNDYSEFSEPWTQVYPDKMGSGKRSVDFVYNGNHIKRFTFIYCDGGRISVALPKSREDKKNIWENKDLLKGSYKNIGYFWEAKSLEYKLTKLIGNFYIYKTIEGVAEVSHIDII